MCKIFQGFFSFLCEVFFCPYFRGFLFLLCDAFGPCPLKFSRDSFLMFLCLAPLKYSQGVLLFSCPTQIFSQDAFVFFLAPLKYFQGIPVSFCSPSSSSSSGCSSLLQHLQHLCFQVFKLFSLEQEHLQPFLSLATSATFVFLSL